MSCVSRERGVSARNKNNRAMGKEMDDGHLASKNCRQPDRGVNDSREKP
jgi:hypothetical protein